MALDCTSDHISKACLQINYILNVLGLEERRKNLKSLLEHIQDEFQKRKEELVAQCNQLKKHLVALERHRWLSLTLPSVRRFCELYQIEDLDTVTKICNLYIPSNGNIYKLPGEQINSFAMISLMFIDSLHRRVFSSATDLPYPIVIRNGDYLIYLKSGSTVLSSDLFASPRIPEYPVNRLQKLDETQKNNWILALSAISYNSIWLTSKIWKRIQEKCSWDVSSPLSMEFTADPMPAAVVNLFRLVNILSSVHADNIACADESDATPANVKAALTFIHSSGIFTTFSFLSASFNKIYDEIEYFWELHQQEEGRCLLEK